MHWRDARHVAATASCVAASARRIATSCCVDAAAAAARCVAAVRYVAVARCVAAARYVAVARRVAASRYAAAARRVAASRYVAVARCVPLRPLRCRTASTRWEREAQQQRMRHPADGTANGICVKSMWRQPNKPLLSRPLLSPRFTW